MTEKFKKLGLASAFSVGDQSSESTSGNPINHAVVEFNSDGTLPVDIFRTGAWRHFWYGNLNITEEYLDSLIANFDKKILGNQIYFDYNHNHDKNFGVPLRLYKETRKSTFSGRDFTVLRADVRLTEAGLADVVSGQVLNFSSEISNDYIHREMMPVAVVNPDGTPALDEDGKPIETYISRRYGPTLVGGAVTNDPFITDLNPNGLGGNLEGFKYSTDGYLVSKDQKVTKGNFSSMAFSSDAEPKEEDRGPNLAMTDKEFDDLMAFNSDKLIMCDDCIYDASEYVNGDANLPDSAFAFVSFVNGADKKVYKIRKLAHHISSCSSEEDDNSVDFDRLEKCLHKAGGIDISPVKLAAAMDHLNGHKNKSYSNSVSEERFSTHNQEGKKMPNDSELGPGNGNSGSGQDLPETDKPLTFSQGDVEKMISAAVEKFNLEFSAKLNSITEENKVLRNKVSEEEQKAYSLSVDKFASGLAGGKASPATQKVVKCGLVGNAGLKLRYLDVASNEYSDISLQDFVDKIMATADFDNIESDNTHDANKIEPPINKKPEMFSKEYVEEIVKDDQKFKDLIREVVAANGFIMKKTNNNNADKA